MPRKKTDITIFLNVHKKEGEKTPDYRGHAEIDGQVYDVALWTNREFPGGWPVHLSGQLTPAEEGEGQ